MKSTIKALIKIANEIGFGKGFQEGFNNCKEIYSNYIILPKCYACNLIGDQSHSHLYGTEPACSNHATPINSEIQQMFPLKYKNK